MPYSENSSFIGCHNATSRVTYDAILRKHELIGCHNKKKCVPYGAIMQEHSSI